MRNPFLDRTPQPQQKLHISPQRPRFDTLGGGAHDVATAELGAEEIHHFLQALTLALTIDFHRYTSDFRIGQKHEKAGGQRNVSGEPRPLGADGVFDHLHHDLLVLSHQVGNGRGPLTGLGDTVLPQDFEPDIRHMQESGSIQADIHEGGFHTGQDARDTTFINIAHQAALTGPLNQNFLQNAVFDHSHPRLARRGIDQNFVAGAAFGARAHAIPIPAGRLMEAKGEYRTPVAIRRFQTAAAP